MTTRLKRCAADWSPVEPLADWRAWLVTAIVLAAAMVAIAMGLSVRRDFLALRPRPIALARSVTLLLLGAIACAGAIASTRPCIVSSRGGSVAKTAAAPIWRLCAGRGAAVGDFKWRHFQGAVILWAVRWYCKYGISYRNLEEMLEERGVEVDHTTIYRWVQHFAPEMEKRLRWYWRRPGISRSWRVDETYVKVKGKWVYLYRAVDKEGDTIDFYLSPTRNTKAAKRFLGKALTCLKDWQKPLKINTDKAPTYGPAIVDLKKEGKLPDETLHRQIKYLNNVVEADHGKLKQLIKPVRGFKSMKTAYATIKGFEVMHALRKGQAAIFQHGGGIMGEVRLIERQFNVYTA